MNLRTVIYSCAERLDLQRLKYAIASSTDPKSEILSVLSESVQIRDWMLFEVAIIAAFSHPDHSYAGPIAAGLAAVGDTCDIEDAVELLGIIGTKDNSDVLRAIATEEKRDGSIRVKSLVSLCQIGGLTLADVDFAASSKDPLLREFSVRLKTRKKRQSDH